MTPAETPGFDVEVIRSARRKKTSEARLITGNRLQIRIPARMSRSEEQSTITYFVERFSRRRSTDDAQLESRAHLLADRYGLPRPQSIRWVSNQQWRWGSCHPDEGSIRLSDRMAGFPQWVVDYVIVHELAHLVEGGHGPEFWALVEQYPRTERARGFLTGHAWAEDPAGAGSD